MKRFLSALLLCVALAIPASAQNPPPGTQPNVVTSTVDITSTNGAKSTSLHYENKPIDFNDAIVVWSLPVVLALIFLGMWVESVRGTSTFKFVHLVTDSQGRGSKYAVAYMVILIIGGWAMWVMVLKDRLQEWYWSTFLGVFLLGAIAGTAAAVKQSISTNTPPPPANAGDQ